MSRRARSEMRSSWLGRLAGPIFPVPVLGRLFLQFVVSVEGGQMFSLTLRRVLRDRFGVVVGPFSYGSLLEPGMAGQHTVVGAYVSIGPGVRRFGANHPLDRPFLHAFTYNPQLGLVSGSEDVTRARCEIGDDAWIGANVVITAGCRRIGKGSVVAAGAVVTRDVEDFDIVAGVPARKLGQRLNEPLRRRLTALDTSALSPHELVNWARDAETRGAVEE